MAGVKVKLFIIAPSSYDDDGTLLQYYRILMKTSSSTVLKSLALATAKSLGVDCEVVMIDERLEKGEAYLEAIKKLPAQEILVFITVKSFELPRGIDIATNLRERGIQVVLGGPGVTLADWKTYELMFKSGLSFNVGEGELTVGQIVGDFLNGRLKTLYWQKEFVDLSQAPLPALSEKREHLKCLNPLAGIGTSEGCPFKCSYCCIAALRGANISKTRARDPELVADWIEETHRRGLPIMLMDDNFRRSFHYETLKNLLIKRNERQKRKFRIFAQIDVAPGIMEEIPDLARMGINHVFPGMESIDPEVLLWMKKTQNHPEDYVAIARRYRQYDIMVNAGVMIGFPPQTSGGIVKEIQTFTKICDLVSLNIATPVPGSLDYETAVKDGTLLTFDLNRYSYQYCCRDWFEKTSPREVDRIFNKGLFQISTLRGRLANRSMNIRYRNIKNNLYARALVLWGYLKRGRPYYYMMDGIPRNSGVLRPRDGFRGFPLTVEDLAKKRNYLEGLV